MDWNRNSVPSGEVAGLGRSLVVVGQHILGTTRLRLRSRNADGRTVSLPVRLWYPADKPVPTQTEKLLQLIKRLPHRQMAPAWHDAKPAMALGRLPLIIYVHDVVGRHEENSHLLASLASRGFMLAAIESPHGGASRIDASNTARSAWPAETAYGVKRASLLLDALHELRGSGGSVWSSCIDLKNVGILGYGVGGGVAAESTHSDARYKAAANLGGPIGARTVTAPYLVMLSDNPSSPASPSLGSEATREVVHFQRAWHEARLPNAHVLQIKGTQKRHFGGHSITVQHALSEPLKIPASRVRTIVESYTAAFFSTYLQHQQHPLMCVKHSPYSEVHFLSAFPSRKIHRATSTTQ